jgi:hypothetical protein
MQRWAIVPEKYASSGRQDKHLVEGMFCEGRSPLGFVTVFVTL